MSDGRQPLELSPVQLFGLIFTALGVFFYYMSGFLTQREHSEFVARFNNDISRLESVEVSQNKRLNNLEMLGVQKQIDLLRAEVDRLSKREDERHLKGKE